jgi:transposase
MGNPAGVKRNFDALEIRRLQAAKLLKQGIHEAEVARRVGVHRQSVNRWAHQLNEAGVSSLKKAGRAGRKQRLSAADLKRICKALKRGSEILGYNTGLWTARRVTDLIERECGIRYHSGHVGRILGKLGWSCRWLIIRASNRDEDTSCRRKKHGKRLVKVPDRCRGRKKQFVRMTAWLPGIDALRANSAISDTHQSSDNSSELGYYLKDSLLPTVVHNSTQPADSGTRSTSDTEYPWRSSH